MGPRFYKGIVMHFGICSMKMLIQISEETNYAIKLDMKRTTH
jgi:hypothetical protein